jgi:DNA-binding NarL/FixJ family response regulator
VTSSSKSGQPTGTSIRVVIVDDHAMIRAGLQQLLTGTHDIVVVGQAEDGEEAIEVVQSVRPDVVLMDLQMPGVDGVTAIRRLKALDVDVDVLVLTSFNDGERIVGALDAGAVGYLLKDADPDDVLRGIRAVSRGESPIDPKAARTLLGARAGSQDVQLTSRETEVLALVREGLANRQVARRLDISERTVKAHLTSAFARIGVSDRTQAALWAERHGL